MPSYMLIESRDPFEVAEVENDYSLATALAKAGNPTTLFLVQNGVLPTRRQAQHDGLAAALANGVSVVCDAFSLRERGIGDNAILDDVSIGSLDAVVDHLALEAKTIWL